MIFKKWQKILIFFVLNIGFALGQIWIFALVHFAEPKSFSAREMIQDGVLYFYSTMLVISYGFLRHTTPFTTGGKYLLSLAALVIVLTGSCIFYALSTKAMIDAGRSSVTFEGLSLWFQLVLAVIALTYAFAVSMELGKFKEGTYDG